MTPCCTNCLHWDEDQADLDDGKAPCAEWRNSSVHLHIDTQGRRTLRPVPMHTTGDYSCAYFCPKSVPPVGERTDR